MFFFCFHWFIISTTKTSSCKLYLSHQNNLTHSQSNPFLLSTIMLPLFLLSCSADASSSQSGNLSTNARKRFTLQRLSNTRSLPSGNTVMPLACGIRCSLGVKSSLSSSVLCHLHFVLLPSSVAAGSSSTVSSAWSYFCSLSYHISSCVSVCPIVVVHVSPHDPNSHSG